MPSVRFTSTVINMAGVIKVLVSEDRRWRVDIRSDGRCEIRELGFLRATVRRWQLEARLAELGMNVDDLVED
jgi:hypothetical protein